MARISLEEMKLPKKNDGISENSRATPPVRIKLTIRGIFNFSFFTSLLSTSFSASIASKGMVNSAITRIDATVRNFAYMGT